MNSVLALVFVCSMAQPSALSSSPAAAAQSIPSSAVAQSLPVYREAVVVGYNSSPRIALAPLKYADDDAIRLGTLLALMSDRVTLLVDPDDETKRLYPGVASLQPSRQAVLHAVEQAKARIDNALEQQQSAELFFAYSGHGDVDREGRGLVYLQDGALTQRDLAAALGDAPERYNVTIMVDACNAALLVGVRGQGSYGDRVPVTRPQQSPLAKAGLILSTSGRAEVHEWELLLSGIFSYEVRSGLLGAADLDDNQQITFAELDAFVAAANARIDNPIARLAPTIRGPRGQSDAVVLDLSSSRAPALLRVGAGISGHAYLQDASLVRYADFNKDAERGFWVVLVNTGAFAMVVNGKEYPVVVSAEQVASMGQPVQETSLVRRGMLDDYYQRHLFETTLDLKFARQHWSSPRPQLPADALSPEETLGLVMAPYVVPLALAAGLATLGGAGYGGGWLAHTGAKTTRWADDTGRLNDLSTGLSTGGLVTAGVGGVVLVATAVVLGVEVVSWQIEPEIE